MGYNSFFKWLVYDNRLYLREVCFFFWDGDRRKSYPKGEEYDIIEKFTGCKFRKSNRDIKYKEKPKATPHGSIFASWVTGEFYIKHPKKHKETKSESGQPHQN